MSREHECLSQLTVERFLLGEAAGPEQNAIQAAIDSCEDCAARVAETRADTEAFAFRPVPDGVRKLWTDPPTSVRWPRILAVVVPVAAAAAIALVLVPGMLGDTAGAGAGLPEIPGIGQRAGEHQTTLKGFDAGLEASLGFYVLRGGESVLGRPGEVLGEGDRIQFWYELPIPAAGVVVGIDGRGAVTRYFPSAGGAATALRQGKGHVLESSVILDDAIGVERFFLCTGEAGQVRADEVERAARELAESGADLEQATRLPIDCDQASVWIRKE